jgi:hypothetical protein
MLPVLAPKRESGAAHTTTAVLRTGGKRGLRIANTRSDQSRYEAVIAKSTSYSRFSCSININTATVNTMVIYNG